MTIQHDSISFKFLDYSCTRGYHQRKDVSWCGSVCECDCHHYKPYVKTYKRNLKSAFTYFKRFLRTRCDECFTFCLQDLGLIKQ